MSETTIQVRGGVGFMGLLTLLFIALKLTGYINWLWLWVLSPLWIPPAVGLAVFAAVFVAVGVVLMAAHTLK